MKIFKILTTSMFLISTNLFGQWNVQTGYDLGVFTNDYYGDSEVLTEKQVSHMLNRFKVKLEYQQKNNFLISFNTGIDVHNIKHDLLSISQTIFSGNQVEKHNRSNHHSTIQNYNMGLSVGYMHSFNDFSSISFEVNYDQFFVNTVKNKKSYHILEYYTDFETQNSELLFRNEKYTSMIDLNEIGYKNKLKKDNRNIILSLGYRYQKGDFFINPSIGFSALNNSFVRPAFIIPKPQSLFLFGVNFGYTLPQKSKNNEK